MSKRGGRHASRFDEDDCYDEDDDYYYDEEEEFEEEAAVQPKAKTPQAAPAQPPAATADPEAELLAGLMPSLRSAVGPKHRDDDLRKALREANYDVGLAEQALLAAPSSGAGRKLTVGSGSPAPPKQAPVGGASGGKKPDFPRADSNTSLSDYDPSPNFGMGSPTVSTHIFGAVPLPVAPPTYARDTTTRSVVDSAGREALGVVMAGHVDTGKSTLLGHLLVQLGVFAERDVSKFEAQCKRRGKQSFHYAWILDQSEEERRRGVTIDAGVQSFLTEHRRVSVLDAPGHKDYVQAMVTSSAQADVAVFVVSAAQGEFEVGLANMTKEHLCILRALGVGKLIVAINKMDLVDYSQERFEECRAAVCKLIEATDAQFEDLDAAHAVFCPLSGFQGVNLTRPPSKEMPWYDGRPLVDIIDTTEPRQRLVHYPLRLVVSDCVKNTVTGRLEAGKVRVGDAVSFVPSGVKATVRTIDRTTCGKVKEAEAGDAVELVMNGDLTGVSVGVVGCPPKMLCGATTLVEAHVQLFPGLPKVVLPGTKFLMQLHALSPEVTVTKLCRKLDQATGKWSPEGRLVKCLGPESQGSLLLRMPFSVAMEMAADCRALGRFVLLQEGVTVGAGLVTKLLVDK